MLLLVMNARRSADPAPARPRHLVCRRPSKRFLLSGQWQCKATKSGFADDSERLSKVESSRQRYSGGGERPP